MSERWADELMPDEPQWVRDLVNDEIESLRSRLASAQDSANTWHTRAEVHRQAAENTEKRLADLEGALRIALNQDGDHSPTCECRLCRAEARLTKAETLLRALPPAPGVEALYKVVREFLGSTEL